MRRGRGRCSTRSCVTARGQMLAAAQAEVAVYVEARRSARRARPAAGGPERASRRRGHHGRGCGAGAGVAGQRQARRGESRGNGGASPRRSCPAWSRKSPRVGRGASAAAPAWPVQLGLRTGARGSSSAPTLACRRRRSPGSPRTASWSNDPTNQEVISKRRDQGGHETGRHVGQRELPGQVRLLDGVGCMDGLRHAGWAGR